MGHPCQTIRIHHHGGPEVLSLDTLELAPPRAGQALVEIAAAGVNFIDVYHRTGLYPNALPFAMGTEGAGTVLAIGPGVSEVSPGDRVAFVGAPGAYGTQIVVPAERLVHIPNEVELPTAAAAMLQGLTAHYLVHSTFELRPGMTCLVHAAAGGAGQLLVQMAKLRGARVLATVSTEEKAALARLAGADEVILYSRVEVAPEVRRLTDGKGVHVVYDSVGKDTFEGSLASLAPRGMLVSFGQSSGPLPPLQADRLRTSGSLFFTRPSLFHYIATRAELLERAEDLFGWIRSGRVRIHIDSVFSLTDTASAHRRLESRASSGKILLRP